MADLEPDGRRPVPLLIGTTAPFAALVIAWLLLGFSTELLILAILAILAIGIFAGSPHERERGSSSSAVDDSGEDGGDDSVNEVVPTPKKILEVDLTSSPVPTAMSVIARVSPVATGCKICLESIRDVR